MCYFSEKMRYDQPFCIIGGSKGKFRGAHYSYLPPLELPEETPKKEQVYPKMKPDQLTDIIDQLRGEVKHIHLELHKIQGQRPKKRVYNKYE